MSTQTNQTKSNSPKGLRLLACGLFAFLLTAFNAINAQTVTIEKAMASGCYYYSGASKTTISVQVGWTGASSADLITVTLDGSTTRTIKPQSYYDPGSGSAVAGPIVTPQVVAFEINADGASHNLVAVMSGAHSATSAMVGVSAPSSCSPTACSGTDLGGMVYYDNDADGTHDAGEIKGIANVTVKAWDKNGNSYVATSDANGKYAFSAANGNAIAAANFPVRVEFTNFPANTQGYAGPSVSGNTSSIRFVAAPGCGIDCGGVNPASYSQTNPVVFSNIHTTGNPLGGGDAGTNKAIIAHNYNNMTDLSVTTIATASQVGSLWAHAWNKYHNKLFSAAFLKRHTGLGPLGLGGIYAVDYSVPASPVVTSFLDVATIGINVGSVGSNVARGLPASKTTPSADATTFDLVGKVGIGGMDLSDDGNTIYIMNLYDKKVYAIDITAYLTSGTLPTSANVTSYQVPDPGCVGGDFRPFALKVYDGKLYAGMVCDASTGTKSNLVGFIKAMDLTTNTWSDVFDFPLTYPKGYPSAAKPQVTGWNPWTSNISTVWNGSGVIVYPTPMLSDIEFDLDGAMVIALIDRVGHQMGNFNYDNAAYNAGEQTDAGGDLLRAFYSNGTYILENNAKAGPVTGYAPNNNQGPGFGEFYHDDFNVTGGYHTEMATGGLLIVPGSGEVLAGMVDPSVFSGGNIWANGVRKNSNSTGQPIAGKSYYTESGISLFGKANGMGDIEPATAELTFLEIGNYVWYDSDGDGVQDPTETGIQGVKVSLYNATTGALVKTTTTDANGNYYFSTVNGDNIQPNTQYNVVIGDASSYNSTTGLLTVGSIKYQISPQFTGQGTNATLNDNNFSSAVLTTAVGAQPASLPKYTVTTGNSGYVNHSIDLGLTYGTIGNYVWYDSNNDGLQNEPTSNGVNGVKVYLYKETTPGNYTVVDSTTTANNGGNPGYYNFNVADGNYKVKFPTAIGNYPISDSTNQAMQVDGNNDANKTTGFSGVVTINIAAGGLNKDNPTIDAGYKTNIGSLGNYVWYDSNNDGLQNEPASNGINGVKVYLLDASNNKIDSTITANDGGGNPGYYNFPNLSSGTYKVLFPTSVGNYPISGTTNQASQTDGNNDANSSTGRSGSVVINTASNNALDVNNPTIDAGYRTNIGSLGNYVWRDVNGNGLQDEPASNGTNGVKVYLLNGSGVKIDSTVTANNGGNPGYYNFPNLNSGNYQVQFPTVVGGFPLSSQTTTPQTDGNSDADATTGKSPVVVINTNSSNPLDVNNPTIDAGYGVLGSLGNYVWYDDNANGLQDEPASNGVNGVKVILYKETTPGSGIYAKYDSTTTANDGGGNPGYYTFEDLFSANYKVQFPTSVSGFPVTTTNNQAMQTDGNNDANSAGFSGVVAIDVTLGGLNRDNPTIDAGYTPIGSLGNYVWYDANKNGLQDEPNTNGINDIKVYLYKETSPGVYTKVDSTITANDGSGKPGYYVFDTLVKGNYKVQFPTSEGSYYLTPTVNQSATTDGNSDANTSTGFSGIIPLNPKAGGINKDNPTIDAGYYCDCNGFKVDIVMNKTYDCVDGNSFSFSANINRVGGKYHYSWDFGDGTTSTLANPTHHYATAGEYDVKLTVVEDNFCGCRYEASVRQLYVGPKPVVNFDWQYNGNCLTYDFNTTSTVSMGWIAGFFWDFGNGTTSTQSNPLATFATAGTYNVKLVVTTNYGCKDSIIFPVNIIDKCTTTGTSTGSTGGGSGVTPAPCNASWWSQNATNNCDSTLRFNVSNPTSGATYTWNFGDGATGTGNAATHKYAAPGNYSVKLVVSKPAPNACADSLTYNIYVSNCSVSSGIGSGLESKTLGDVLAVRLYGNAINSTTQLDGIASGVKFNNSGVVVNGINDITLNSLVPTTVAGAETPYVSTPADLTTFTNAVEVLAIDYTKNSSIKAVAFGTKTLGDVYAHTKPICDRLKGAELLEVKTINVNGFNVMAYKVRQRTGEFEYAMNLSAGIAAGRNSISLQSNWFTDSYVQDEKLYNFQLWAVSYDMVKSMAQDIITKLQANGTVNAVTTTDLPKAYISKGNRRNTDLNVTIQNNTPNTTGYFELREKANENAQVTTRQVPFTAKANGTTEVTLPVKDNYEGNIYVYLNNKLTDLVYLADGTWALDYNKSTTSISKFDVSNESSITTNNNEYRLFRNISVTGISKDYITVYKTMMGGGLEQNVSNYKSLMFTANAVGAGSVTVSLVKKSITDWKNQYTYTLALDGNKEYGINLNQFTSKSNANTIDASDIVAVNFSFNNSRGVSSSMNINLSKARFADASVATDISVNTLGIYPNPTVGKFAASFNSTANQPLVLKVIEASTGKVVKTQFINAVKGINQVTVDNTLSNGLYIVTLDGDSDKFNPAKLMVSKK